ncbi:MAG: Xaa-Pro peptidase family protein [Dysgonamonadaceae bacterium]|nr:Xaa-Pro peptidase family protein [Dysgonamonadaceae bacterium]
MDNDLKYRRLRVQKLLSEAGADACIITTNVNIYYLTGKVFTGFIFLPAEGEMLCFVQRPVVIEDEFTIQIRKPEEIPAILENREIALPKTLYLESGQITHLEFLRLEAAFHPQKTGDATSVLRTARMIKSPWEIEQFRISAVCHSKAYSEIAPLFREGMTDIEFQIEIERVMRRNGSIGIFRAFGGNMDIFMGSVLTGKNAETPSPFDFALGGAGLNPTVPIGACGEKIEIGNSVMVDMAGNFTAYMTDMTRVFARGKLPEIAYKAHNLSIAMHNRLMSEAKVGTSCADIYKFSLEMAENEGLVEYFMGTRQQAKFVGHGVGLEINEPPVLTPRSKEILEPNMVFAFEPKFVIPGVGAVGNENTYLVSNNGLEKITKFDEEIISI